jgi:hypothetical protein
MLSKVKTFGEIDLGTHLSKVPGGHSLSGQDSQAGWGQKGWDTVTRSHAFGISSESRDGCLKLVTYAAGPDQSCATSK